MKKKTLRKLSLSRETLTFLAGDQVKDVQGGAPNAKTTLTYPNTSPYSCQDTVQVCCA